jgi:hypothetical protein
MARYGRRMIRRWRRRYENGAAWVAVAWLALTFVWVVALSMG